jgi:hypothetical protein
VRAGNKRPVVEYDWRMSDDNKIAIRYSFTIERPGEEPVAMEAWLEIPTDVHTLGLYKNSYQDLKKMWANSLDKKVAELIGEALVK